MTYITSHTALAAPLRKQLEKAIKRAREVAEEAAADAIRRLSVAEYRPQVPLDDAAAALRRRLRAHARTLGDRQDDRGNLSTDRLQEAAAYELWHRMLFGRFLVERGLLKHPELGAAMTLEELTELAPEEGARDAWSLAERYAASTLPAVFKPDDPVLAMPLDPSHHKKLQDLATGLDPATFAADDALGWTYQYWRSTEKEQVNAAGGLIGAAELPAVTQLFTEPYMVRYLLHNTLGAWWAGKVLAHRPDLVQEAKNEDELRAACTVPGAEWSYLRFARDPSNGGWRPAAGTYPNWPERAANITILDPCCGSGHFLVEALNILAALRAKEEGLTPADAACLVLRNNLHGLELDGRCVQIAAFAVALAAWRIAGGPVALPNPHLAWVGAPPPLSKKEMGDLADDDITLRRGMEALHDHFAQAPLLGSLLAVAGRDLLDEDWRGRQGEALEKLSGRMRGAAPEQMEGVVAARGLLDALGLMSQRYVLQATNVPFLGSGNWDPPLANHLARHFPTAKADLAAAMLLRLRDLAADGGTIAAVTPQSWLRLKSYREMRTTFLASTTLNVIAIAGPRAFETISGEVVNVCLISITSKKPENDAEFLAADATDEQLPRDKDLFLKDAPFVLNRQSAQKNNLEARILVAPERDGETLSKFANVYEGLSRGDASRFDRFFWELFPLSEKWRPICTSGGGNTDFSGRSTVFLWEGGSGDLSRTSSARIQGIGAWGRDGVVIERTGRLRARLSVGDVHAQNCVAIVPNDPKDLGWIYCYVGSEEYREQLKTLAHKLVMPTGVYLATKLDREKWKRIAAERYPNNLPEPSSSDPTQWLFHGHPAYAEKGTTLLVALARLSGYRWPAEFSSKMRLSAEARKYVSAASTLPQGDPDGLLPLHAYGTAPPLADRLRTFLAITFGSTWSNALELELVRQTDLAWDKKVAKDGSLEGWLRDRAFRQHCKLFADRPFLWQVWDGLRDGFSAFVHYHRLNHATMEKLTYTLLGDWLRRAGDEGQDLRMEKARVMQQKLEGIIEGDDPNDIFVRWKALANQPVGWVPAIDDGVRQNIRPFVLSEVLRERPQISWADDKGAEPMDGPWHEKFCGKRKNAHHIALSDKKTRPSK